MGLAVGTGTAHHGPPPLRAPALCQPRRAGAGSSGPFQEAQGYWVGAPVLGQALPGGFAVVLCGGWVKDSGFPSVLGCQPCWGYLGRVCRRPLPLPCPHPQLNSPFLFQEPHRNMTPPSRDLFTTGKPLPLVLQVR